jgi:hypothetical protein
MKSTDRYVTGLFLTAAIVVFSGCYFLRGLMNSVHTVESQEVNYNMPRPKSALYNFFFGLEGREIQRKEIDPFKDKQSSTSTAGGSVRKADAKKDATKAAAAKATVAKNAAAAAAHKKPEVKVNVIPKDEKNGLSATADGVNPRPAASAAAAMAQAMNAAGAMPVADDDKVRLSPSQWRSLVVGQPTKENVAKLIAAFNEKEVDAGTLYMIMNDLEQSSNAETQVQGLTIAQQVPSLRSFTVTSSNYDKFDATVKRSADAYFLSYMQPSRLPILAMALQSEDNSVVHRAAQVMVTGLRTVKSGGAVADASSRPGRGVSGLMNPPAKTSYANFIPLFEHLEKNSDSTISGLAQNALTQLQALSNT